jgi:hypothetical protein
MKIQSLGYDPEADELDLLIDVNTPQPAESVSIGEELYLRRDPGSGRVVGAMIRGYSRFRHKVLFDLPFDSQSAEAQGYLHEFEAIIQWQQGVESLSQQLVKSLGDLSRQRELLDTLLEPQLTVSAARESPESYEVE